MTTYTKLGYALFLSEAEGVFRTRSTTLTLVANEALTTLRYDYEPSFDTDPSVLTNVTFANTGSIWNISLDGQSTEFPGTFATFLSFTSPTNTTSTYLLYDLDDRFESTDFAYFYLFDGPEILGDSLEELPGRAPGWTNSPVTSGPLSPNTNIEITSLPWDSISEDDRIVTDPDGGNVDGGIGNDTLIGGDGDDMLMGSEGDDIFMASDGYDTIDGGAGNDSFVFTGISFADITVLSYSAGLVVRAGLSDSTIRDNVESFVFDDGTYTRRDMLNEVTHVIRFFLADGDDTFVALDGPDSITAGLGNDIITPGLGSDTVDGGAGTDTVSFIDYDAGIIVNLSDGTANSGPDRNVLIDVENITGSVFGDFIQTDDGVNRVRSSGGYDWLVGSEGADYFDGGTGRDMISYVYADTGVTVDLGAQRGLAGQAAGDRYVSIERVTGSIYADLFYGSEGQDDFRGLGGYDWFVGSTGGRDRYDGGASRDTVAYSASTAGVVASLALGYGAGGDALRDLYTSIENLTGSSHDDVLTGDSGRNILRGLYGQDTLYGGGGVDRITGGALDDYIDGGAGWDVALFEGARDEYTVTIGTTGVIVEHNGRDGTDTIFNIEALQFADDMVFL